jgi:hypothetical protein
VSVARYCEEHYYTSKKRKSDVLITDLLITCLLVVRNGLLVCNAHPTFAPPDSFT